VRALRLTRFEQDDFSLWPHKASASEMPAGPAPTMQTSAHRHGVIGTLSALDDSPGRLPRRCGSARAGWAATPKCR